MCQGSAVLHIDGIDVGICAKFKRDRQIVAAIRAGGRLHVDGFVDPDHLLLDRLCHCGFDNAGIRARIIGGDGDLRWDDVGKLRDRDLRQGDQACNRDDDRNDKGKSRAVDKDRGNHWPVPFVVVAG